MCLRSLEFTGSQYKRGLITAGAMNPSTPYPSSPTPSRLPTVVVADSFPTDYMGLLGAASEAKVQLTFVGCGRHALQLARRVDVVHWLMHVELPDMTGFDLCQMVKGHWPDVTVTMVTDEYGVQAERSAYLSGASMFRCKPAEAAWLEDWLNLTTRGQFVRESVWDGSPVAQQVDAALRAVARIRKRPDT